ncbi:YqhA family protein, partial [Sagittula sp.]
IISVGLYSLFINTDVRLPEWLKIRTLDDLKNKLLSVVIVVLAVVFLGQAVAWDGARDLMGLGIGIAAVIAALTWFISVKAGNKGE